jgi:hypothetical protein
VGQEIRERSTDLGQEIQERSTDLGQEIQERSTDLGQENTGSSGKIVVGFFNGFKQKSGDVSV